MVIKGGTVITPFEMLKNTDVVIEDTRIKAIMSGAVADKEEVINAEGLYVCPGFIDIHSHGGFGGDFMDATDDAFDKALMFHAKNGTTSIVATSVTAPIAEIEAMLQTVRMYKSKADPICRVLGAHIEGPYLSVKNKGAQKEEYLRVPSRDGYDFILANSDVVLRTTVSAELEGMENMVRDLTKVGIAVSCGHDDGNKESIMPVIECGASMCTHWYCAMSTAAVRGGKRSVGLMEIGLIDDRLTLELIADNHHTVPELVKLAYKCKGAEKLCLVSDSLRAAGLPSDDTIYSLGTDETDAQKFFISNGVAMLCDGTRFAGSVQSVGQMVKNLVCDCGIPLLDSIRMATYTPALSINMENEIGSISVGKKADICIMDKKLKVVRTITNGKIIS